MQALRGCAFPIIRYKQPHDTSLLFGPWAASASPGAKPCANAGSWACPEFTTQRVWEGTQESAFLTRPRAMRVLGLGPTRRILPHDRLQHTVSLTVERSVAATLAE